MCIVNNHKILSAAVIAILFSGCGDSIMKGKDIAYRNSAVPISENEPWQRCSTFYTVLDNHEIPNYKYHTELCNTNKSVELRKYKTVDKVPVQGDYLLGFVEFDDQGWFHTTPDGKLNQRTNLFKALLKYSKKNDIAPLLIVTYAHGWQHNAEGDDEDVADFSKLLEHLDLYEEIKSKIKSKSGVKPKRRKVVGVYLGWFGKGWTPFGLNIPTDFWSRKNSAERVGDHSAKQLLMELNQFRVFQNGWDTDKVASFNRRATSNETQLIMLGHSFGGLLMYHALNAGLLENNLRIEKDSKFGYQYDVAKSIGDFVMLVNPAMEGSEFEALHKAAQMRECYDLNQKPNIVIVQSKTDYALKWAFPFVRQYTQLQYAGQPDERDTVANSVGFLNQYITHDLAFKSTDPKYDPQAEYEYQGTSMEKEKKDMADLKKAMADLEKSSSLSAKPVKETYADATLTRRTNLIDNFPYKNHTDNFPYMVISADKSILNGHTDIWNDPFVDFMHLYIGSHISPPDLDEKKNKQTCTPFGLQATDLNN